MIVSSTKPEMSLGRLHLNNVESTWKVVPVWMLFELGRGRVISHEEIWQNQGEFPVYSSQTTNDGVMGYLNTFDFEGNYLTWTTDGANAGTVFHRNGKFNCTNVCGTLRPTHKYVSDLRFFKYALDVATDQFVRHDINPKLMNDVMAQIEVQIPSHHEQRSIADYLDREIGKIDVLVGAMERLLMVLAEKRQAVITHAVTRGLDPSATLRDSGIPWLGKIPAHWRMVNLKHVADVRNGVTKGKNLRGKATVKVPYLRVANVQDGFLDLSDVSLIEVVPEDVQSYALEKGDVLMNEGGDIDKLGRGAVWDGSIEPCIHQNHVYAVRCFAVQPEWLSLVTGSTAAKAYFESHAKRTTNLASISATNLKEVPIPLPPIDEQHLILQSTQETLERLTQLTEQTAKAIKLLQERRVSLISAAVTGQLRIPT